MKKSPMPQKSKGGYLEALLNSCPSAILAINADGIITFANKESSKLVGCEMSSLIGESISSIYASPDLARETNRKLFMSGGIIHDHESKMKSKSGQIIPVRISAAHLKDSAGSYIGAVGYFETYRPWTAAEANLKAYAEELEAKLQEWHDLGAPVFELYPGLTTVVIVGRLDVRRFSRINSNLLDCIKSRQSEVVLLDLSAALVDEEEMARQLVKTIRTVHLLGAKCILAGMQTSVAQAIEPLITDMGNIRSFSSTSRALEAALDLLGFDVCHRNRA